MIKLINQPRQQQFAAIERKTFQYRCHFGHEQIRNWPTFTRPTRSTIIIVVSMCACVFICLFVWCFGVFFFHFIQFNSNRIGRLTKNIRGPRVQLFRCRPHLFPYSFVTSIQRQDLLLTRFAYSRLTVDRNAAHQLILFFM